MVNENGFRREKLVYQASDYSHSEQKYVIEGLVHKFLEVAHWASNRQIQLGIRGFATRRYTTLEKLLKRKSKKGEIRVARFGKINVYALPRKTRNSDLDDTSKIYHGLCCTECLIRFIACKEGDPLPEGFFRGYGRVPEFGIRYENDKLLLCEFSTKHDTFYSGKIRGKLFGYDESIMDIERDFNAKCIVVFILDVPRKTVRKIVDKYSPSVPYFFCDFETFKSVRIGEALVSRIYFWKDGKEYSLA